MSSYNLRRVTLTSFRIVRFDDLVNVERIYHLHYYRGRLVCDCFDYRHNPTCKHCEMLSLFLSLSRQDSGWMYDHDHDQWWLNVDGMEPIYV